MQYAVAISTGESRLHEARGSQLTVWITNRRVIAKGSSMGSNSATSLPLEKIDSMQQVYTSRPFFVIIGAILAFVGLIIAIGGAQTGEDFGAVITGFGVLIIAVGIVCVIIWALTRKQRIVIRTQQSSIDVESGGLGVQRVEQFLTAPKRHVRSG